MVIVAKHAGFCFGVKRAVETAKANAPCSTLGEIIHNRIAVQELEQNGVHAVASPMDVKSGTTCIIRSHGAGKDVYRILSERNVRVVDATCPRVKAIHTIVSRIAREGRGILVAGRRDHPEVEGILGHCEGNGFAVLTDADVASVPPQEK